MQKVFVIDASGKPLLPCHPARARKLLTQHKAVVRNVIPFTIQLTYVVDNPVGSFSLGIDDGAKTVGLAILNSKTNEIVFQGEIQLRQDISRKVEQRRNYRNTRRSRKLRCRKARFSNRIKSKLPPSAKYRKDCVLRFIKNFKQRLNITKIIIEEVSFNHVKHKYGKYFSWTEVGKNYLMSKMLDLGLQCLMTHGYNTKQKRIDLGLSKTHFNDAIAIVSENIIPKIYGLRFTIKPRRTKIWENNPTKTCTEKNGFRHYDIVKTIKKGKIIIGNIKCLAAKYIKIRTKNNENEMVSYKKAKLLERPNGLIFGY